MKPKFTIEVKVHDTKFDVTLDTFDPSEPYVDGVWVAGSIQEISDLLDDKVLERIEEEAIGICVQNAAEEILERGEAWS